MFGNSGAKFVVQFSIEGSGEKTLDQIADKSSKIIAIMSGSHGGAGHGMSAGLGKAKTEAEGLTGSLEGAHEAMTGVALAAGAVSEIMDKVAEGGLAMMEAGVGILHFWEKTFSTLLEKGSEFEQMIIRIRASNHTSAEAQAMVSGAVDISAQLPITEKDATRIVQTMATAHVDALARIGESYDQLEKKGKTFKGLSEILGVDDMVKKGPTAVTVVADVLAAAGQLGGGESPMAIHELMLLIETGKLGSRQRFGALTEELRHVGKASGGAAGRLKALQEMLEKRGALGAAQASMNTYAGQMTNLKGILDMVSLSVMEAGKPGGLQDQFVKGLKYSIDLIREFFNPKSAEGSKFLGTLKEVGSFIGGIFLAGLRTLADTLKVVFTFMGDHPAMMKFVAGASLVAAAMLILGGGAIVLSATLLGAIAVIAMMPEVLLVIPVAVGLVVLSFMALAGAFAVGYAAYAAFQSNFGGIKTFFEDVGLIIDAVREALDDWGGSMSTISEETYQKLEKAGVTGYFLKAIYWIRQAQVYWEGFSDALEHRWDAISSTFGQAWAKLSNAFGRIMTAASHVMAVLLGSTATVDDTTRKGEDFGNTVADILERIAEMALGAANWLDEAVSDVPSLTDSFADTYVTVLLLKNGLEIAWDIGSGMALGLAGGFRLVATAIMIVWDIAIGLLKTFTSLLNLDFSGMADAIKNMGKNIAGHAVGGVESSLKLGAAGGRQLLKVKEDIDDMGDAVDKGDAMKRKGQEWRFGRTGAPALAAPQPVPLSSTGGVSPYSDEYLDKRDAAKEKADRLNGARDPAAPVVPPIQIKGDVNLDGHKLGDVLWDDFKGRMEREGHH